MQATGELPYRGFSTDSLRTNGHNVIDPKISIQPIRRMIAILDKQRATLNIRIPEAADKDRRGATLITGKGFNLYLSEEPAGDRTLR